MYFAGYYLRKVTLSWREPFVRVRLATIRKFGSQRLWQSIQGYQYLSSIVEMSNLYRQDAGPSQSKYVII